MVIFTETKFTEWAEPIPASEVHPPCSRGAIVREPADGDEEVKPGNEMKEEDSYRERVLSVYTCAMIESMDERARVCVCADVHIDEK